MSTSANDKNRYWITWPSHTNDYKPTNPNTSPPQGDANSLRKSCSLIVVGDVVYRNAHDILEVEVPIPVNGNGVVNAVALE